LSIMRTQLTRPDIRSVKSSDAFPQNCKEGGSDYFDRIRLRSSNSSLSISPQAKRSLRVSRGGNAG
jgi:hypothetical protein